MADETRELQVIITAKDEASRSLSSIGSQLSDLKSNVQKSASMFAAVGTAAGIMGKSVVDAAGEMQATRTAFKVLIGDAALAEKTLKDLFTLEARTPFTIGNILQESKKLLAMGTEAKDLTKTLSMLGDIASGVGFEKLPQLTLAFGQIQAKGRLMGTELRQLTEAGFNLADAMGVSSAKLDEMITNKEVGFEQVRAAFERVTAEGGRFNGLMAALAQTTPGRLSTLSSEFYKLKVAIGDALLPSVNMLIDRIIPLMGQIATWVGQNQMLVVTLAGIGVSMGVVGGSVLILMPILTGLIASFRVLFGSIQLVITIISTVVGIIGGPLTVALIALIALVTLLAVAWKNNWGGIQEKTKAVVDWFNSYALPVLQGNFKSLESFVSTAMNVWISNFNRARDAVGSLISALDSLMNKARSAFSNGIGGYKIPGFQHGGFVSGAYNQAVPAILHGGERVVPRTGVDVNNGAGGSGGGPVNITFTGPVTMDSENRVQELAQKILDIMGRQNELAGYGMSV